ncbi:glucoside xylosyltransferase 1-like [Homarus americanus]|uniref:glucoside xylosyltransferase 1-like n=1 Tax=Homarus americanus TaxID=6706 RepID=UPI001C465660|nr:glucoside xylosyltransferase 1-like [Homarus americanus]
MTILSYFRCVRKRGRTMVPFVMLFYVAVILMFVQYNFYEVWNTSVASPIRDGHGQDAREIVFFISVCKGEADNRQGGKIASDIDRQLRQTAVLLKSAAALSSSVLRFKVVTDSEDLFHQITNLTSSWPADYQKRILMDYHKVWYPAERKDMRSMFRVCSTERLFIPEMFSDLDAGIYVDTDMLFLRPPEQLWEEFQKFNDVQLAALAPCLFHYDTNRNKLPYYGKTGLNAGVMLLNITRMKSFPEGGWMPALIKVFDRIKKKMKLADQDIINVLFSKYPELMYELGCEWNYRIFQCSKGTNKCPDAATNGISLLHGNALAFVSGEEMKIQAVFEAWERHVMGSSVSTLLTTLQQDLESVSTKHLPSKCARISNIDSFFIKELQKYVLRK